MSLEALANISRKNEELRDVQVRAEKSRQYWIEMENDAKISLENVVALVIDSRSTTLTKAAKELSCSRDKVKAMADRARKRSITLLRKGQVI